MPDQNGSTGEKAVTEAALQNTVQVAQHTPGMPSSGITSSLVWMMGQVADEFEPWGRRVKLRDAQLRAFIGTESIFTGALGSICSRNAGFSWYIEGGERTRRVMQRILESANFGRGWTDFVIKLSMDLYSQDTGAFFEIIREGGGDSKPTSPLLGIASLDAARCWATGDPEKPVIYQDTASKYHVLNWWQAVHLTEMPMPVERINGGTIQLCAQSRLMIAAQIIKNASIYKYEKVSGRYMRGIHIIQGVTTQELEDAIAKKDVQADAAGLLRYMIPLMVGTVDPEAKIDVRTLELATLPENWDEESAFKHYIAQIALAFLSDYQDFAPLPGGNLGTSAQSEVLHMKSRGKGPALFQKIMREAMNNHVMPNNVEFGFDEQDLEAEKATADIKLIRATTRATRIASGELTIPESRQEATDVGDLAQELFERSGGLDMTPIGRVEELDRSETDEADLSVSEGDKGRGIGLKEHKGLLVALWLNEKDAAALELEDGVESDSMHITVAYVVKPKGEAVADAKKALAKVVKKYAPVTGTVSGVGIFNGSETSDNKDVLYASFDSPVLSEFRQNVVAALEGAGLSVSRDHGYTPHMTLAYVKAGKARTLPALQDRELEFGEVTIRMGDEGETIPFVAGGIKSHRRDQCMAECEKAPEFEIIWAEGKAHAWFCYDDLLAFDKENPYEINTVWRVEDGVASRRSPKKEVLEPSWKSRALQTA